MRVVYLLTIRELKTYFLSMMGYIIWTMFLLVYGYVFWVLVNAFSNPQNSFSEPLSNFFFGTFYYWFILIIIPPLLTMRSIAGEKRTGTFELLVTAPITEAQIVIGKFLAAGIFFIIMWISTLFYFYLIAPHTDLDWNQIFNGYLGTVLVGALFISFGIFASALTKSQITSAIVSFSAGLLLFSLGFISYFINIPALKSFFDYINIMENTMRFSQGVLDSRTIVYFLSMTVTFLFLSIRVLDIRRWR